MYSMYIHMNASITHPAVNCKTEMAAHTRNGACFVLVPYDNSDRRLARMRIASFHSTN